MFNSSAELDYAFNTPREKKKLETGDLRNILFVKIALYWFPCKIVSRLMFQKEDKSWLERWALPFIFLFSFSSFLFLDISNFKTRNKRNKKKAILKTNKSLN